MMPSANTEKRDSAHAGEHVEHTQNATASVARTGATAAPIDARHGNVRTDPEHDKRHYRNTRQAFQVGHLAEASRGFEDKFVFRR